jgi:NAD-dependent deacetylase
MTDLIEAAAALIRESRMTVCLSGAGISVPSGIPDFRSPGSGLWEKVDVLEVATIDGFTRDPSKFFKFMAPVAESLAAAKPNPAHIALADMEKRGLLRSVITQNIDTLHQQAGSATVYELHGNTRSGRCMNCLAVYSAQDMPDRAPDEVPYCRCGGVIKPDVVLFGESLPFEALARAQRDAAACDVMLVAGSSLTVAPASMLPQIAFQNGAQIIIVNLMETYMDQRAAVVLRQSVDTALPAIAAKL